MIYVIILGVIVGVTTILVTGHEPKRDDLGECIKIVNAYRPKMSEQVRYELLTTCLKTMRGE